MATSITTPGSNIQIYANPFNQESKNLPCGPTPKKLKIKNTESIYLNLIHDKFNSAENNTVANSATQVIPELTKKLAKTIPQPLPEYDAICFAGGGAKGFAYAGVIEQLGDRLNKVKEVSGASAGAITAMFVALGLNSEQIIKEFSTQHPSLEQTVLKNNIMGIIERALTPAKNKIADVLKAAETAEYLNIAQEINLAENTELAEAIKNTNNTHPADVAMIVENIKNDITTRASRAAKAAENIREAKYADDSFLKNITLKQLEIIRTKLPELNIKKTVPERLFI